jgi:hypothetical protein
MAKEILNHLVTPTLAFDTRTKFVPHGYQEQTAFSVDETRDSWTEEVKGLSEDSLDM